MSMNDELFAHLQTSATSMCNCWKITRKDEVIMGFTDHDRDIEFDSIVFNSITGAQGSQQEAKSDLSIDNGEIVGALSHDSLNAKDIEAGAYDRAQISVFAVNWQNAEQRNEIASGWLGDIKQIDGQWSAEIRGLGDEYSVNKARYFTRRCNVTLGSAACGVDVHKSEFSSICTIAERLDDYRLVVGGITNFQAGFFSSGRAQLWDEDLSSSSNLVAPIGIAEHVGSATQTILTAWRKWPEVFSIGQAIYLVAGCDRTFSTCRKRFNNGENFQGFPHIPGNDFLLQNAGNLAVHDGGALVSDDE